MVLMGVGPFLFSLLYFGGGRPAMLVAPVFHGCHANIYSPQSKFVCTRNNVGSLSPFFICACNSRSRLAVNHRFFAN